jgi:cobalamin biosynthesis Mg chelatase CobN
MQGAPRRSARSFFVLPLVLALLALVAFPFSAFAESGEIPEYEVEVPHVENETVPPHPKKHKPQGEEPNSKAHASANPGSNSESEESEGSNSGGAAGNGTGSNGTGQSEGGQSPSNGGETGKSNTGGNGGVSELKEVEPAQATGKNASESSGGGSSPVVPILIAVVVLAAISIGVVLYRQKQQSGNGPDGGRKPGQGSDGPVSSPNAS